MSEKEFLTRPEAAEYLGIGVQTLANNRRTGPAYHKMFGAVRYSKTDLDSWARQQRVTPSGERQRLSVHRLGRRAA
ncbi:helix-turn-helix domain-containing protein [Glutamicibacter sp. NPDC127525]|uniref:helix-turn-helix domain-containing protein n=1 Tax=unclassified Glutamicibacter TaxID=2627139 RepID=UPI00363C5A71